MTDAPSSALPSPQPQGQIQLSRAPDGSLVVQIVESGQKRVLQMSGAQAKALLWQIIATLSFPQDPPPQPLPTDTAGMPIVHQTLWLAGLVPEGAQVALWIPGLGFCVFSFTRDSCARLGAFLVQASQMADPLARLAKN